jgi:hypothetical protein
MPTVNVTKQLVGIWFLALTEKSDWLCSLTEVELEKVYEISYRFRYYEDDEVFESKDRKSSYRAEVHSTRSYAIACIRSIADGMKKAGASGEVDELLMHKGDIDRFMKELSDKPWAFMRIESGKS